MKLCRAEMHGIRKITKIYIKLNLLNQRSDFLVLAVSRSSLSFKVSPSMLFFFCSVTSLGPKVRLNLGKDVFIIHFPKESSTALTV